MPLPELFYWAYLKKAWDSLHEPRTVTAMMVVCYLACFVGGVLILGPWDLPTIFMYHYMIIEGVILVMVGLVGAPSAWLGKWLYERVAVIGFTAIPTLLFVAVLLDMFIVPGPAITQVTIGGGIGLICWAALGATRWYRIRERPYAPGRGPVPLSVQTREIDALLSATEEAVNRRCGRG